MLAGDVVVAGSLTPDVYGEEASAGPVTKVRTERKAREVALAVDDKTWLAMKERKNSRSSRSQPRFGRPLSLTP